MSNDTEKQNDKQELNNWQKLHKQLDDSAFAYEFKEKTFSRAKANPFDKIVSFSCSSKLKLNFTSNQLAMNLPSLRKFS